MNARPNRSRLIQLSLFGAVTGLLALLIAFRQDPRHTLLSYLFAFACVFPVVVGALMQVMIGEVTGAAWFAPLRPFALHVAGAMPAVAVLALPVLLGAAQIYPWAAAHTVSAEAGTIVPITAEARAVIARTQSWLNAPFFVGRGLFYLAAWIATAEGVRRARANTLGGRCAGGLVLVGLTFTFAAFDWLMSLDAAWYSTVYGVYLFAGGILCALCLVALFGRHDSHGGRADDNQATNKQAAPLGKLIFTFSMFWAYIAFSQYLIIWMADIPAEASWYALRLTGNWRELALVVAAGQFLVPFALLLSYRTKRNVRALVGVSAWLVLMHVLDCYWLVMPVHTSDGPHFSWIDCAAVLTVVGIVTAAGLMRAVRSGLEVTLEARQIA